MSQYSLYRKHRPTNFKDYNGDFIKSALKRLRDENNRPQIMVFHGNYGCGKTSASRLAAGYYLCESLVDGEPCGTCSGCNQVLDLIREGEDDTSSESIQEINGSAVNGVADIKRIMNESMMTLPSFSKYKVFIIDECHRITPEAQNALLKILEDVPRHLVIIFATTEVDKMLPTVLSRCQLKIEVRKQTIAGMTDILIKIAKAEKYSFANNALELIAKKGGRIPRDCIQLLEDIAITYDGQVTLANVLARTGEMDTKVYFKFIEVAHKGLLETLTFISEFSQGDLSYPKFISGLSRFVMEAVYIRMGIATDDYDKAYLDTVKLLFNRYKVDEFHILLKLVDDASRRSASDTGSTELALSVLALKIGDVTKVQDAVGGDSVKSLATSENSTGARKFVARDTEKRLEENAPKQLNTSLDDFMASIGAVNYEQ